MNLRNGNKTGGNKGIAKAKKARKREEAEIRNAAHRARLIAELPQQVR